MIDNVAKFKKGVLWYVTVCKRKNKSFNPLLDDTWPYFRTFSSDSWIVMKSFQNFESYQYLLEILSVFHSIVFNRQVWIIITWQNLKLSFVPNFCCNDVLSSTMSWVGCLLTDSKLFTLFAENSQILLKISVVPIPFTFIYLVALHLIVNNQLNSSLLVPELVKTYGPDLCTLLFVT